MVKKQGKPTGPKPSGHTRTETVAFVCYPEYKAWLNSFAVKKGLSTPDLIEWALRSSASRSGFDPPPER